MPVTMMQVALEEAEARYTPRFPIEAPDGYILAYSPLEFLAAPLTELCRRRGTMFTAWTFPA